MLKINKLQRNNDQELQLKLYRNLYFQEEKPYNVSKEQKKFYTYLKKAGYAIHFRPLSQAKNGKFFQKGIDTSLSQDLIGLAQGDYFDKAILVSGDFLHYTVNSWMGNDGFEINIGFNLGEAIDKGAKVGLREKFTIILDDIIRNADTDFHYLVSNKNTKFKEILIEGDDYTDEDLKNVAEAIVELITNTYEPIQNSIDVFKDRYSAEFANWKVNIMADSQ